jgi:cell division transport system permease protein
MAEISKTSMKRSTPSYFFSILGVALVLLILGILGWLVINASKLESYFREASIAGLPEENAPQRHRFPDQLHQRETLCQGRGACDKGYG